MTPCRDPNNVPPNFVLCDCPIHDHVAELLGIVSTTGRDFRPAAERAQAVLGREAARKKLVPEKTALDHVADARRHADEAQRQYEIAKKAKVEELPPTPYPTLPPRPRKPKATTPSSSATPTSHQLH